MSGYGTIPNELLRDPEVSMQAKIVYAAITSYAYGSGRDNGCYRAVPGLCAELGIARSTFYAATDQLKAAGWISVDKRRNSNKQMANVYWPSQTGGVAEVIDEGCPPDGQQGVRETDSKVSATRTQKNDKEKNSVPDGTENARERANLALFGDVGDNEPKRKVIIVDRKKVPTEMIKMAERIVEHFASVAGYSVRSFTKAGDPTPAFKQVVGQIRVHDDVSEERWKRAITNVKANPPRWAEDDEKLKLGTVFGGKSSMEALQNSGGGKPGAAGDGKPKVDPYEERRRRREAEGWG